MQVQILGPVGVLAEGGSVQLGAPKERAVLAMLALAGDAVVSEGTLIDGIWGDEPPRTAAKVLQNLVLKIRKPFRGLGLPDPVTTRPGGYQLAVGPEAVDLHRVEALRERARRVAPGNPALGADLCREALALWRGEALADLGDLPFVLVEAPRLAELRLALLEERLDADLELGRQAEVVAELEALCAAHPLRERFVAQRMTALYRCGRQAEALRAFQQARAVLAEELGLDPGPRLVELERAIAADDPALLQSDDVALPAGTVTFLFSDIEASTTILRRDGDSYRAALEEHNRLLRGAWTAHRGVEIHTVGDAFFVAFQDASDAVAAAVDGQAALAAHRWPEGAVLKVRIGIHTGEAQPVGRDYVAIAVHHAARIANTGHGGQVVVSDAALAALGSPPEDVVVTDLGLHQVRDFSTAVRLHQVHRAGNAAAFPPLRTLGFLSSNLPLPRTSFVGRVEDRAEVAGLLGRTRVVTIQGPGGVGKTRLALEVARDRLGEHPDGVFLADLTPVRDLDGVARTVADALALPDPEGQSVLEGLLAALRTQRLLLLLDNCEHVIDAAAELVEELTATCAHVAVLATSRETLRVDGEAVWRLAPLHVPSRDAELTVEHLLASEAVQLFVDRVQLVQPAFRLDESVAHPVAQVVSDLDGIPLAIELAAAATGQLPIGELATGLDDRFNVLTNGRRTAPARQQTLWAVVDWSYGLLQPAEQELLRQLAVFSGTFGAEGVDAVASPPRGALERLVQASLVTPESSSDPDAPARYRLLETVRAFAQAHVDEAGDDDRLRTAHLDWARALVQDEGSHLTGPDAPAALQNLERDHDNLRAALAWAMAHDRAEDALRMATKLVALWDSRGHRREGTERLRDALAAAGEDVDPVLRIEALYQLGGITGTLDPELCEASYVAAMELADATGNERQGAYARMGLGLVRTTQARLDEAMALLEQSVAVLRATDDIHTTAQGLERLSEVARSLGDMERYTALMDEAIALQRASGDRRDLFWSLAQTGQLAVLEGDRERAVARIGEARTLADELRYVDGDAWIGCCEGMFHLADGDEAAATERFEHAHEIVRATEELALIDWSATGVAWLAMRRGDLAPARSALVEQAQVGVMGYVPRNKWHRGLHTGTVAAAGGAYELAGQLWVAGQAVCPEVFPPPAGQDAVDAEWLAEVLQRELGDDRLASLLAAARVACDGGADPMVDALAAFAAWTPPDGPAGDCPPIWRPW